MGFAKSTTSVTQTTVFNTAWSSSESHYDTTNRWAMDLPKQVKPTDFSVGNGTAGLDPLNLPFHKLLYNSHNAYEVRLVANGRVAMMEVAESKVAKYLMHALNWHIRHNLQLKANDQAEVLLSYADRIGIQEANSDKKLRAAAEALARHTSDIMTGVSTVVPSKPDPTTQKDAAALLADNKRAADEELASEAKRPRNNSHTDQQQDAETTPPSGTTPSSSAPPPPSNNTEQMLQSIQQSVNAALSQVSTLTKKVNVLEENKTKDNSPKEVFSQLLATCKPEGRKRAKLVPESMTDNKASAFFKSLSLGKSLEAKANSKAEELIAVFDNLDEYAQSEIQHEIDHTIMSWGVDRGAFPRKINYKTILRYLAFLATAAR